MKILGITGGVGSGKSTVLYELQQKYNAFIVEADKLAHFGKEILSLDSPYPIDRQKLGELVFNDKEKLELLNSISHPLVKQRIMELIEEKKKSGEKIFVIEAALLIECGYKDICDEIWYVWVDREERIKRLMNSRGYTKEKCLSIFNNQQSDEYYKTYANYTIDNGKSFEYTSKQLKDLLNK